MNMLLIDIVRQEINDNTQFGQICINTVLYCDCIENLEKLSPAGEYDAFIRPPTIKHPFEVVELKNVPGRTAIQIHPANWAFQLEGCCAPGLEKHEDGVGKSKEAFKHIMELAKSADSIKVIIHAPEKS